jgi:hypothetical protein
MSMDHGLRDDFGNPTHLAIMYELPRWLFRGPEVRAEPPIYSADGMFNTARALSVRRGGLTKEQVELKVIQQLGDFLRDGMPVGGYALKNAAGSMWTMSVEGSVLERFEVWITVWTERDMLEEA